MRTPMLKPQSLWTTCHAALNISRLALAWLMASLGSPGFATVGPAATRLRWDSTEGVIFRAGDTVIQLDGKGEGALLTHFFPSNDVEALRHPKLSMPEDGSLILNYEVKALEGAHLDIERQVHSRIERDGIALIETFTISPSRPLTNDVEFEFPFALSFPTNNAGPSMLCPLKNGWAKSFPLNEGETQVEYRLGSFISGKETPALALPFVLLPGWGGGAAIFADPMFSTLFSLRAGAGRVEGTLRFRYAASQVPLSGPETRTFVIWLPSARRAAQQFPATVDTWFRLMLPDVPPGPKWLHEIAMVGYDFLSDDGKGWDRDVRLLADWIKPSERHCVALCLHGWYDALGSYCYDTQTRRMKEQWVAFERTRKVSFTQAELKRRLRLAHDFGFRVLLYFADGVAADSGVPGYRDDWAFRDANGNRIGGWQGPDTFGPTYMRDLGKPEVISWHTNYLAALLQTYGADIDGLNWDETFHAGLGQISRAPCPAYCDRTMMTLVKTLTRQLHAFDPQKVFLASDCIGVYGWTNVPGYGMMADGTYQDTHCDCVAWSYGLFPNWRNTLWSCNWDAVVHFERTRWGVRKFGAPVAISNGWDNDCGPSEWSPRQRDAFLRLFRERLKMDAPVRFFTEDPAKLASASPDSDLPGDAIPEPAPGEVNWALDSNGSLASASSEDSSGKELWPALGAIDGVRDDGGWGDGHGWTSKAGEPLPQWLQVNFGQQRSVGRFVVFTYQNNKGSETAGRWGVRDYVIEVWDPRQQRWQAVARQSSEFPKKVRVHPLSEPVTTDRFRIVVSEVAPLDGQARLLQVEAWGR
jgi:hypothetical protein